MKIEKVNDHQIRCTLTKSDLADREIKISELAYGTEKAKNLFRDMMQQASAKFGFEADDIPLMIEAIPLNAECIVLIITKVEDPEELDTRFSRFAPFIHDDKESDEDSLSFEGFHAGDEVLDLFQKVKEHAASLAKSLPREADTSLPASITGENPAEDASPADALRIFSFRTLYDLMRPAAYVAEFYNDMNYLYKDPANGHYLLVVTRGDASREDFNRTCNILSEYGQIRQGFANSHSFYEEHYERIAGPDALQKLA